MPRFNDKELAVARVYGRALLSLADNAGQAEEVLEELMWLADYAKDDAGFSRFISSPTVDENERGASLEKMFRGRLSDLVVDALQVINRKGRMALLPAVAETYRQDHRDLRGHVDVHVRTAVPLSDGLRQKVHAAVAGYSGLEPKLHESVDESLIGGIVLQIGDRKIDASVKNEVHRYRKLLLALAEREILGDREDALIED
ncbi:MAG: ATP synthase F1 subunit delta [Acidobacteriota bacterium]